MTVGYVNRPSYNLMGSGGPMFKYDVFRGRPKYRGGRRNRTRNRRWRRGRLPKRYANYAKFNTIKGRNLLRLLATFGPKILNFFKSAGVRKVAGAVGTAGASAAINTALDKLTTRKKTPLKKLAKKHGTKAAVDILQTAKEEMGGTGRRRRRRRGRRGGRRKVGRRRVGRPRRRLRTSKIGGGRRKRIKRLGRRRRRTNRKLDIFDRR